MHRNNRSISRTRMDQAALHDLHVKERPYRGSMIDRVFPRCVLDDLLALTSWRLIQQGEYRAVKSSLEDSTAISRPSAAYCISRVRSFRQ
ncbi:hypothetical protein OE88DRAFT_1655960 [Heliocybe sulcata]|uniref:Uncharacterized protein n=1 Tax=Heliocybe sulcata TaxID=5364 RepID=A0A5C3N8Y8_9AGAM|nr:hypothetical protein OE88DRAFT_1655960 [Heliocybe sulcata]